MLSRTVKNRLKEILGPENVTKIYKARNFMKPKKYDVIIDINNVCNLDCIFCPRENNKLIGMKTEDFSVIMSKLDGRINSLLLSCTWEFSVATNAAEIVRVLEKYDFPTTIYTNGNFMSDDLANALIDARIKDLVISLGETRKETYNAIRKNGDYERVISNIRRITEYKKSRGTDYPRLCTNSTLLKSNIDELVDYVDLAHELGIEEIRGRHLILNEALDLDAEVVRDEDYANNIVEAARKKAADYGMVFAIPNYSEGVDAKACTAPWDQLYISSDGDVSVCPRIHLYAKIGNLVNEDLSHIMNSSEMKDLRKQFTDGDFKNPVCAICMEGKETEVSIDQGF